LAVPIADVLARVRSVIASAEPFEATRSTRRFTIGAPNDISAAFLPPLLAEVRRAAPGIDISVRHSLPQTALADLDARAADLAIAPLDNIPARFAEHTLYEEDLVIAARVGHPFLAAPTLDRYCAMLHLVASLTGDARAYVDEALGERGLARRVAVTVPDFMLALAVIAETDLLAALPRSFVAIHARRFGVASTEAPLPLRRFQIRAVAPKTALMDGGLAWLFDTLVRVAQVAFPAARTRAGSLSWRPQ
jgi:DNA-binding transcriptional LysR family regulator